MLLPHTIAPAIAAISPTARPDQSSATGWPMKLSPQCTTLATDRPITPPQPAGSASTEDPDTNASALAISATPIAAPRNIRPQRPSGRSRHSRIPRIGPIGSNKATAGPNRVSAISANQAPGGPTRLSGYPPDAVFNAASLG